MSDAGPGCVVVDDATGEAVTLPPSARIEEIGRLLAMRAVTEIGCQICGRAERTRLLLDDTDGQQYFRQRGWQTVASRSNAAAVLTVCRSCYRRLPASGWMEV